MNQKNHLESLNATQIDFSKVNSELESRNYTTSNFGKRRILSNDIVDQSNNNKSFEHTLNTLIGRNKFI